MAKQGKPPKKDRFDLSGRVALVTGASRGIGRALALGLAEHGANVIVHYVSDKQAALSTVREIHRLGRLAVALPADFRNSGAGTRLGKAASKPFGPIDIAVLNAANGKREVFTTVGPASAIEQVRTNFLANFEILQICLPTMAARRWGRVLTIGSVQQVRANPGLTVYAAMKAAQMNLVTNLARQYARDGVTVNNLAPGLIETDSTAAQTANPKTLNVLFDEIPARSVGMVADCVGPALMLCSEAGRYINGENIFVDGGMHLPGRPRFVMNDGRMKKP